jgi:diguanylate cyclase (GGDEF)-like protein/PAS domain S-box-containing protein
MKALPLRFFVLAVIAWTVAVAASLIWNAHIAQRQALDEAYTEARASLNKDITFRRWATEHGGVYVPITETQKSIPWLAHVPGRDVTTSDGRQLTLLNPASMLRQVMDRYAADYGVRGRITGLKQLNPDNAPDAWEREQLLSFARGEKNEIWAIAEIDGKPYLRYLRAMMMEPGCDKCHAILGYKTGDLRGATGLNMPLAKYYKQLTEARWAMGLTHGGIWLLGLAGIGWAGRLSRRYDRDAKAHDDERRLAETALAESEQRLALTVAGANLGTWDWHVPSGRVVFNARLSEMLGYTPEEFPPHVSSWQQLIHPDDVARVEAALLPHLAAETAQYACEHRLRHKAGHWVWVLDAGRVVERDAGGEAVRMVGIHQDISERREREESLRQARVDIERLSARNALLLEAAGEGIYGVDGEGRCTFVNPAACVLLGYAESELLGKFMHQLVHHSRRDGKPHPFAECPISQTLADGEQRQCEDEFIRKDGAFIAVQLAVTPIVQDGQRLGAEVLFHDIGQRKRMEADLLRLATSDSLTGLANRRHFLAGLELELARLKRFEGQGAALLMFDLDNFKQINDTFGHAAGDAVLRAFADALREPLRKIDLVGRLGGEEFALLLPGNNLADGALVAERLRDRVAGTEVRHAGAVIHFTTSIGVTTLAADDESPDNALRRADDALYRAKENGRDRVELVAPGVDI